MSGDVTMRRTATTKGMNDIPGYRPAGVMSEAVDDPMLATPSEMVTYIPPLHTDETRVASGSRRTGYLIATLHADVKSRYV
jgi:hypothetical protein